MSPSWTALEKLVHVATIVLGKPYFSCHAEWGGFARHMYVYCMSVYHELPVHPICTSSQSLYIIDTREAETLGRLNRCRMSKKISMNLWTQRARAQVFLVKGLFTITS